MSAFGVMVLVACLAQAPAAEPAAGQATGPGPSQVRSGALYHEATFRAPAADSKAFAVGDVVTVQVLEASSATTSTETATRRKNNLDARAGLTPGSPVGASLSINGDFDGGGETQRANRLLATVAATVVEVLPNGDLRLSGTQLLTVNDEQHSVLVEGRARPRDISGDNVVLSPRLAEARIVYAGEGELTSRQRPGLWRRFVDWLGF